MDLSVGEVATLLGQSTRTVRARAARGDLPASKVDGHWRFPRDKIPLTETQRKALLERADNIREELDAVLPSRLASARGDSRRSVADLAAFRHGLPLLRKLQVEPSVGLPQNVSSRASQLVEQALLFVAEGSHQYDPELKKASFNSARAALGRCAGLLVLHAADPPQEPIATWLLVLEHQVIPAVAGLARQADRRSTRSR